MKTVVCVKQVVEVSAFVEFDEQGTDVDPAFKEPQLNEADTYAVEEALRLREAAGQGEVVVVTAGEAGAEEALRACLAMGADRAVRVACEGDAQHDPLRVARALAGAVRAEEPDLVLCGVQSSDAAQQSTGPALAAALDLPCVSVVTRVEADAGAATARLHREFEGGLVEVVEVERPAVLTVQTGLNTPRYGSFKEKLKAKKAAIPVVQPEDVGPAGVTVRRMYVPDVSGGRGVELIQGGPSAVAERLVRLVREVN
ncbi:electron transfer flavoprotein subunit beta/FixA family protein [Geodermatophilus sp. SYSU D00703]